METLYGKIEVIQNWCWYQEEILETFSEIISEKLGKNTRKSQENLERIYEKLGTYLKRNIFMKILPNFYDNFWKNLRKIVRKLQIILEKNCRGTWKNFGNIWNAFESLFKGVSKFNPTLIRISTRCRSMQKGLKCVTNLFSSVYFSHTIIICNFG